MDRTCGTTCQPTFAGLGVGPTERRSIDADQILGTDVLTITFNSLVTLTGVATLFDTDDHDSVRTGESDSDESSARQHLPDRTASATSLLFANFNGLFDLTGHDFTFAAGRRISPSFYVSASAVPDRAGKITAYNANSRSSVVVRWWPWSGRHVEWTTQTEAEVRLGNYD